MPELIWKGKKQEMNHHLDVPVRSLDHAYTYISDGASEKRIIHGDNLEALKALLPESEGRIQCIAPHTVHTSSNHDNTLT